MVSAAPVSPDPQAQATAGGVGGGVGGLGPELLQGEAQPNIAAHGFGGEMGQPIPSGPQAPQAGAMNSPIIQKLMAQLSGGATAGLPGAGTGPMGMGDVSGDLSALGVKQAAHGCPVVTRSTKTVRMPSVAPKDNETASTTDMARSKDFKGAKPVVV